MCKDNIRSIMLHDQDPVHKKLYNDQDNESIYMQHVITHINIKNY